MGNRGGKVPVCPNEPPKRLMSLTQSLKKHPISSSLKIPLTPAETPREKTNILCQNCLDTHFLFLYIHLT